MSESSISAPKLRGAFLLLLAIAVSLVFFRMIQDFVLAVLLAAIFAGLANPPYQRISRAFRGKRGLAAATTVV